VTPNSGTDSLIRFVLAKTSRGTIILMCSDLTQDPLIAMQLYCCRVRIETLFDTMKNQISAFSYRFWTRSMSKCPRRPSKNSEQPEPQSDKDAKKIKNCWNAYERFMMCGLIATGILQICALKFPKETWAQHNFFIRTKSRALPSEKTVKMILAPRLISIFINVSKQADFMKILKQHIDSLKEHDRLDGHTPEQAQQLKAA
jgi:hypothetical protein